MSPRVMHAGPSGPSGPVADLAHLEMWLKGNEDGSVIEGGGAVSQWSDLSGQDRHATQDSGADQPTTGATTLNGKNVIDFADDYLVADTVPLHSNTRGLTMFAVATFPSSSLHLASRYDSSTDRREWAWGPAGGDMVWRFSTDGVGFNNLHVNSYAGWAIIQVRWNPGSSPEHTLLNDGSVDTDVAQSSLHTSDVPLEFGRYNLGTTGNFSLAEFVAVSDYLDGQELSDVQSYLSDEWGIAIA